MNLHLCGYKLAEFMLKMSGAMILIKKLIIKKNVLILHGSDDSIVPLKYSKQANETYSNSTLHIIDGAGHGFNGEHFDQAMDYITEYLDANIQGGLQ